MRNCLCILIALFGAHALWAASVLTQHNDIGRSGANLNETILNTANVNVNQFGKLFSLPVDGQVYGQILYVPGVAVEAKGTRDVIYVATAHDSVYMFDAVNFSATPLYQVSLGTAVPYADVCWNSNIAPEVGIISTPVIDAATGTLYVEAKTREGTPSNYSYVHRLHALDMTNVTREKFGGPVVIAASVPGTGYDNTGGVVAFNGKTQLNRPGLLLLGNNVYIAYGSHGDTDPYHGWILGYDKTTLAQTAVYNDTPNGSEGRGGIWQTGQGITADASGFIYVMTGNGDFTANTGGTEYGDSFVKLSTPNLQVVDYFTPYDEVSLNDNDTDLGSAGPLLIPGASLLVGGGKEGKFYLLNVDNTLSMGHFNAANDAAAVQSFTAAAGSIFNSPVFWSYGSPATQLLYIWTGQDYLKAYQFSGSKFNTTPVKTGAVPPPPSAGMLSLSANGNTAGTGVLWASVATNADPNSAIVDGTLHAFDATDITQELWNSKMNQARDNMGNLAKFNPPTVLNGKVYLPTFSGKVQVYGILAKTFTSVTLAPSTALVNLNQSQQFTATAKDQNGNPLATQPTFIWTVTGTGSINAAGLYAAGITTGSATVTASATVGTVTQSGTAGVTVTAAQPVFTSVAVAPISASTPVSGTQQFTATALDQNGNPLAIQPTFIWTVTGTGSINAAGLYAAGITAGSATVTASATVGAVTQSGTASVTVTQTLASVTIAPASVTVSVSGTQQFTATALDQNGNPLATQPTFIWTVTGTGSINAAGLYAAGITAGSATVTASATVGTVTQSGTAGVYARLSLVSAAKALPAKAGVGQTVNFSVQVGGGNGPLTYSWAFGDGTPPSSAAAPSHAYVTAGTENAVVTVSDGNTTLTSSVTVTVQASLIGTGNDSDGDGFSDSFKEAVGCSASGADSTPFGTAPASISGPFNITALTIKLNFVKPHSDSMSMSGRVPVAAGKTMLGKTVVVSAGDYVGVFPVNAKGKSQKSNITLSVTKPKSGFAQFALKASQADLVAAFAGAGMTATAPKATSVNLPCIVLYPLFDNGVAYSQTQALSFTQTKGKTGVAKLVK